MFPTCVLLLSVSCSPRVSWSLHVSCSRVCPVPMCVLPPCASCPRVCPAPECDLAAGSLSPWGDMGSAPSVPFLHRDPAAHSVEPEETLWRKVASPPPGPSPQLQRVTLGTQSGARATEIRGRAGAGLAPLSPRCGLGVLFRMIRKKAGEERERSLCGSVPPGGVQTCDESRGAGRPGGRWDCRNGGVSVSRIRRTAQ